MKRKVLSFVALLAACFSSSAWGATPIASWTDFNDDNLTAGSYTLVKHGGSVNADGSYTVGGGGLSLDYSGAAKNTVTVLMQVSNIPDAEGVFVKHELSGSTDVTGLGKTAGDNLRGFANGTDYGTASTVTLPVASAAPIWIMDTVKNEDASPKGVHGWVNGGNIFTDVNLRYRSSNISTLRFGAYSEAGTESAGVTAALTGMKIHAIYIYEDKLTEWPAEGVIPAPANPGIIGINFASNKASVGTGSDSLGFDPEGAKGGVIALGNWNEVSDGVGSKSDITDSNGNATYMATWSSNTATYSSGNEGTSIEKLTHGYLDNGTDTQNIIRVGGLPTTGYDVAIIGGGDGPNNSSQQNNKFSYYTVNGVNYVCDGTTTIIGTGSWGTRAGASELTEGTNVLYVPGLTDSALSIQSYYLNNATAGYGRGTTAAIMIFPKAFATATVEGSVEYKNIGWTTPEGGATTAKLTLQPNATLTLTEAPADFSKLIIECAGDCTITLGQESLPYGTLSIIDYSGVTGKITWGHVVSALVPSDKYNYGGGAGSSETAASITLNGGTMNLTGGEFYLPGGAYSGTMTTVNVSGNSVIHGADNMLEVGHGTWSFSDTASTTVERLVLSQGAKDRTATLTLADSASVTVTGRDHESANADSNQADIMFGHYNGPSTFTIKDNATFTATASDVLVGKTGNAQTINIQGGTFTARGIKVSNGASGTNTLNLAGGELKLGQTGITSYGKTMTVNVDGDTKITSTSGMTISQPIVFEEGKVLTLDATDGTITLTGSVTGAGAIKIVGGTVDMTALASIPAIAGVESGATLNLRSDAGAMSLKLSGGNPITKISVTTGAVVAGKVYVDGEEASVVVADGVMTATAPTITANPKLTGSDWYWDYEFTKESPYANGDNNFTEENAGSSDDTRLQIEGSGTYTSVVASPDGDNNRVLHFQRRPYRSATYGTEMTVVARCMPGAYANTYLMNFGTSGGNCIIFATGDNPAGGDLELYLWEGSASKLTRLLENGLNVATATTAYHVYAFSLAVVDGKTQIAIYVDGKRKAVYKHGSKIQLGGGFQIGSLHGGALAATYNLNKYLNPADGAADIDGTLDFLRVANTTLSLDAMMAIANAYPYVSENGIATRTVTSADTAWVGANGATPWSQNVGTKTTEQSAPNDGTMITLTSSGSDTVTLAMDGSETTYETMTVAGTAPVVLKGGTSTVTASDLTVSTDLTVDADKFKIGTFMVASGKTLTLDINSLLAKSPYLTQHVSTGLADVSEGATVVISPATDTAHNRTISFGLNPQTGAYDLTITGIKSKATVSGTTAWDALTFEDGADTAEPGTITLTGTGIVTLPTVLTNMPTGFKLVIDGDVEVAYDILNTYPASFTVTEGNNLQVYVAEGATNATWNNACAGITIWEKTGAGTLTLESNLTPDTRLITGGTLKLKQSNANTFAGTFTVGTGATLDMNGAYDQKIQVVLNKNATFANSDREMGTSQMQTTSLTLNDDAFVENTNKFAILNQGYADTTLTLDGHTLTKKGTGTFTLSNTNIDGGTIAIEEGSINFHNNGSPTAEGDDGYSNVSGVLIISTDATTEKTVSGNLSLGENATLKKAGTGTINWTALHRGSVRPITVEAGTLKVANVSADDANPFPEQQTITVNSGAYLEMTKGITYMTVQGEGTTKVTGTYTFGISGGSTTGNKNDFDNFLNSSVEVADGATLQFRGWRAYALSVPTLTVNGTLKDEGYDGKITVPTLTVASGNTLKGKGTIELATTLADGAIIDTRAGAVSVSSLTCQGKVKVKVASAAETTVLNTAVAVPTSYDIVTVDDNGTETSLSATYALISDGSAWKVVAGVAQAGGKAYATIGEAIDAAEGGVVTVLGDVTVPAGKTLNIGTTRPEGTLTFGEGAKLVVDMGSASTVALKTSGLALGNLTLANTVATDTFVTLTGTAITTSAALSIGEDWVQPTASAKSYTWGKIGAEGAVTAVTLADLQAMAFTATLSGGWVPDSYKGENYSETIGCWIKESESVLQVQMQAVQNDSNQNKDFVKSVNLQLSIVDGAVKIEAVRACNTEADKIGVDLWTAGTTTTGNVIATTHTTGTYGVYGLTLAPAAASLIDISTNFETQEEMRALATAKVGDDAYYAHLASAFAAVEADTATTVTLLAASAEAVTIAADKEITFDMGTFAHTGNVTIESSAKLTITKAWDFVADRTITVNGELEITGVAGSSDAILTYAGYAGTGTIKVADGKDITIGNAANQASGLSSFTGTLNVGANAVVRLRNYNDSTYAIALNELALASNAKVTCDTTNTFALTVKKLSGNGTITGGSLTFAADAVLSGTITATGTVTCNGTVNVTLPDTYAEVALLKAANLDLSKFIATGLAADADYKLALKTDGLYLVEKIYVAQVGDVKYEDLDAAINAANGGIVTLLKSEVTWPATIPTGVTIKVGEGVTAPTAPDGYKWADNGTLVTAAVAKIGDTEYETLQDAIDAADADDTVTLVADVVLTDGLVVAADDKLILDLAGKTISYSTDVTTATAAITNRGTLTITDSSEAGTGTITYHTSKPSTAYASNTILNCGTLTVASGTIKNTSESGASYAIDNNSSGANAVLTVTGGTIIGVVAPIRQFANGHVNTVEITAGTVTGTNGGIFVQHVGNGDTGLAITGGTVEATNPKYGTLLINPWSSDGGSLDVTIADEAKVVAGNGQNAVNMYYEGENTVVDADVAITGGDVTGKLVETVDTTGTPDITGEGIAVSGGTFSEEVKENFCADGYIPKETTVEGKTVYGVDGPYEAKVGDTYHKTLEAAIAAAIDGDTVTLMTDVEVSTSIVVANKLTLNLGKYTIKPAADDYVSSTVGSGLVLVKYGADLTIEGTTGAITCDNNKAVYTAVQLTTKGETYDNTNKATLTVTGGTLEGYYYGIAGNGGRPGTVITIEGGTIKGVCEGDSLGIYHPQDGTLTIKDGTIEGTTAVYVKSGTVSITGGTLTAKGTKKEYAYNGSGANPTGDAIIVDNCDYPGEAPTVKITGGTFNVTATAAAQVGSYAGNDVEQLAEVTKGEDVKLSAPAGTIWEGNTLVKVVAEVGGVQYATLEAAINAAAAGGTVTLTADIVLSDIQGTSGQKNPLIEIGKNITLDFAGKKISLALPEDGNVAGTPIILFVNNAATVKFTGNGTVDANVGNNNAFAVGVDGDATLTIENGTYIGGASAVQVMNGGDVIISGGTFDLTDAAKDSTLNPYGSDFLINCLADTGATVTIKGGSYYEFNPADNDAEGEYTGFAPGMVGEYNSATGFYTLREGKYVAGTNGKQYESLAEAVAALKTSGGTLTLMADVTLDATLDFTANENTIDLNGKTLTLANGVRLGATGASTVLNIKNGTINGNRAGVLYLVYKGATLNMTGVTSTNAYTTDPYGNLVQIGSNVDYTTGFATIENCTLSATTTALMVLGDKTDDATDTKVTVTDSKLSAEQPVCGNGNCVADLTIEGANTVITGTGIGVYWPGAGTLTVNAGTITGATAIYVKSGNVIINGGTIKATGEKTNFAHAGNGAYATGDAIVVESCDYPFGAPTVTINGGAITSDKANALGAYEYAEEGETVDASTVTKKEGVELAAPEGYEWKDNTLVAVPALTLPGTVKPGEADGTGAAEVPVTDAVKAAILAADVPAGVTKITHIVPGTVANGTVTPTAADAVAATELFDGIVTITADTTTADTTDGIATISYAFGISSIESAGTGYAKITAALSEGVTLKVGTTITLHETAIENGTTTKSDVASITITDSTTEKTKVIFDKVKFSSESAGMILYSVTASKTVKAE